MLIKNFEESNSKDSGKYKRKDKDKNSNSLTNSINNNNEGITMPDRIHFKKPMTRKELTNFTITKIVEWMDQV